MALISGMHKGVRAERFFQQAQIGRLKVCWHGDLIGGNGSFCPFLLPLPPMIEYRAILLCGLYSNSDEAIILTQVNDESDTNAARMLYTDSGHYLLPTDCHEQQVDNEPDLALVCADALDRSASALRSIPARLVSGPGSDTFLNSDQSRNSQSRIAQNDMTHEAATNQNIRNMQNANTRTVAASSAACCSAIQHYLSRRCCKSAKQMRYHHHHPAAARSLPH